MGKLVRDFSRDIYHPVALSCPSTPPLCLPLHWLLRINPAATAIAHDAIWSLAFQQRRNIRSSSSIGALHYWLKKRWTVFTWMVVPTALPDGKYSTLLAGNFLSHSRATGNIGVYGCRWKAAVKGTISKAGERKKERGDSIGGHVNWNFILVSRQEKSQSRSGILVRKPLSGIRIS